MKKLIGMILAVVIVFGILVAIPFEAEASSSTATISVTITGEVKYMEGVTFSIIDGTNRPSEWISYSTVDTFSRNVPYNSFWQVSIFSSKLFGTYGGGYIAAYTYTWPGNGSCNTNITLHINKDGSVIESFYNDDGTQLTGWKYIVDSWYYFNPNGTMAKGWLKDGDDWYYMWPATGRMIAGECLEIDGKNYLFDQDGKLRVNFTWTYNGRTYRTDENGIRTQI